MTNFIHDALDRRRIMIAALSVLIAGYGVSPAFAAQQVSTSYSMPVHVSITPSAADCENSPGPYITLDGIVALSEIQAQLIFRNNEKGTHTHIEDSSVTVTMLPDGQPIQIPKQPSQGGTGGNPFIYIQFVDAQGNPLGQEIFLGRCVQGLNQISADLMLPATIMAQETVDSCSNKASYITLDGKLTLGGLSAKIIFRNNDNPVGGPHEYDTLATSTTTIIPDGQTIQFPKQPSLGGVGGNPWISLQFRDKDGNPIGDEFLLGRCVQDF